MSQITALGKRPCPDCGGEMEWNAARQAIACPYCGFVPKDQPARGESAPADAVTEHDLEASLNDVGADARGYGTGGAVQVKCQSCRAISVFEPTRVAQRCDFCGSPAIVPYAEARDPVTPQSLLPVRVGEPQVRDVLRQWYGSKWLAPNALKSRALTDTVHGVYLPYWTFDAAVDADWHAESGDYYWDTEAFTDSQGRRSTRRVQKVRWYPTSGHHSHFFDDQLVPGSVGVRHDLLRGIEPFPTGELAPYDPAFVRGWTVERYQVDLRQASVASREQMDRQMYQMCAGRVPGDTHRNLSVNTRHRARTFKHILVPVWVVTYDFGAKSFQVVVNGYTGAVAGDRPTSWAKVFFYIVLPILLAIALFLWLQSAR